MNIDDFDVSGEIKVKITGVKGRGKDSKVWRVFAKCWIEESGEKKFFEEFSQGLRKEEFDLKDKDKLRTRLEADYKELLSRREDYEEYYHDNFVDEEEVADSIEGEVL